MLHLLKQDLLKVGRGIRFMDASSTLTCRRWMRLKLPRLKEIWKWEMVWLVCESHPSKRVAKKDWYVCPGAWGTEGTVCHRNFSCQRNPKGKELADRPSRRERRTVGGKELFPTDSGPDVFCGIVGGHPGRVPSCLSRMGQGACLWIEQSALSICIASSSQGSEAMVCSSDNRGLGRSAVRWGEEAGPVLPPKPHCRHHAGASQRRQCPAFEWSPQLGFYMDWVFNYWTETILGTFYFLAPGTQLWVLP